MIVTLRYTVDTHEAGAVPRDFDERNFPEAPQVGDQVPCAVDGLESTAIVYHRAWAPIGASLQLVVTCRAREVAR